MSKSRNGTTDTLDALEETQEEVSGAMAADMPAIEAAAELGTAIAEAVAVEEVIEEEEEEKRPSRRRRIAQGGTIVLVTAAIAVAAGVVLAMILRNRGSDDELDEDLLP